MSKVEARKRMQSLALHQRLNANNVSEIFKCIDENKPPSPELSFRLMYVKGNTKSPPHCEFEGEQTKFCRYFYIYLLPTSCNYFSWYLGSCC